MVVTFAIILLDTRLSRDKATVATIKKLHLRHFFNSFGDD